MILDTGSPWVWIMSKDCQDCPQNTDKFNEASSASFYFYDIVSQLIYSEGSVYGYNAVD